jgi:hypothetical protein
MPALLRLPAHCSYQLPRDQQDSRSGKSRPRSGGSGSKLADQTVKQGREGPRPGGDSCTILVPRLIVININIDVIMLAVEEAVSSAWELKLAMNCLLALAPSVGVPTQPCHSHSQDGISGHVGGMDV